MQTAEILNDILRELERAEQLHPSWPIATLDQTAIMVEEAGEAIRAALNYKYHGGSIEEVRTEIIQTGAMCIRALKHIRIPPGAQNGCTSSE